MSFLEGATNTTINNSNINNISGDATIFKFDGDGPLSAEFKSLFVNYVGGMVATPDLCAKLGKHTLTQSICNLPCAKAAYDDYSSKDKKRVACFENTRQALLKEVGEWIVAVLDKPEIYLLSGLAGIGKSTVAQTVAERANNLHLLAASFFFSRDEADRRNAEKFYTTIAFQLCVYDEQFAQAIANVLLEKRGAAATTKEPREQLNTLIVDPLRDLVNQRSRPLVIIVDALDECSEEDGLTVLETLKYLVQELPLFRVILTTRPHPHLHDLFSNQRVFYMQDIEDKIVDSDIRLYLKHYLSREQVKARLPTIKPWSAKKEDIESLVQAAGRLFIIASTAVLFILDKVARDPTSQMEKLQRAFAQGRVPLKALNGFYTIILRSAVPANCDRDIAERYQKVIGTIAHVQDPLSVQALADLISLKREAVPAVLDNLQPVIVLGSNDVPRTYHSSFLDYITDASRCEDKDLRIVPRDQHTRITIRCFNIMNTRLKRNILKLGTPAQFMENRAGLKAAGISDDQIHENIPSELRYACVFWANHLEVADSEDTDLLKELHAFANEHVLHWFEALSWTRKLELAHGSLLVLRKLLEPMYPDKEGIVSNALRFISKFYDVIRQSALHAYHSALPFTPAKIPFYNIYKQDMRNLCQLGHGPELWDSLIATQKHEGHGSVDHIVFSPDSFRVALLWWNEVMLCNASAGIPVKVFKGCNIALAGDFSVVTLSQGSTLTSYNISSNAPIANYQPSAKVVQLALSFDGSRLAAGLSNGTVCLWDGRNGGFIAEPSGYAGENGQLEFSPSGYILAFVSDDGDIRLMNGFDGKSIAGLGHESEGPTKFVFSSSGLRLAAIMKKGGLQNLALWNGEDGNFIGVARYDDEDRRLAMSDDGSFMATGGMSGTVRMWNGESLSLVDTLNIAQWIWSLAFSGNVLAIGSDLSVTFYDLKTRAIIAKLQYQFPMSLAFSPDGTRFAAGDGDGDVHLWDVKSLKASASVFTEQPRTVTALAISSNCLRLASGLKDGAVQLWDTHRTEHAIVPVQFHSQEVTALAFSPDGDQVASGSCDGTIKLWDGRDEESSSTLQHSSFHHVYSVAFSNLLLAAATFDDITLWDRKSLHLVHTFHEGSHCLSFSLGSSRLASAYNLSSSADVSVWDVKTFERVAQFDVTSKIKKLVLSSNGSRLVAAMSSHGSGGFQFFDVVKKGTVIDPEREEINFVSPNEILISQSYDKVNGHHLLAHFPGQRDGVVILWIPEGVRVNAFTTESSKFALGCDDGRIIFGQVPSAPVSAT